MGTRVFLILIFILFCIHEIVHSKLDSRTSLVVQWLEHHPSTAGGMGSFSGLGTKILHDSCCGQKKIIIIIRKKNQLESAMKLPQF